MHSIDISKKNMYTDLISEQKNKEKESICIERNIKISNTRQNNYNYTTIYFDDITDKESFNNVEEVLTRELKKYISKKDDDKFLIIGLGNRKSTPDSLGPITLDNILVTSYLFDMGNVEKGYSNVCKFTPSVTGETGIETYCVVKSIINEASCNKVIVIDALKASKVERLLKTIQISNSGIHPGSGINNSRKEISKKTTNKEIIAIGIPTVVEIKTIVESIIKEDVNIKDNLIVTPTNIDFIIEKLSILTANSINKVLHTNFNRQNNY